MALTPGLDLQTLGLLAIVVFFAAVVRGYTGFGLSAILITIATYWIPAHELVPLLILLEITSSILFIPGILMRSTASHDSNVIDWKMIVIIFSGAAISAPLALQLLSHLPTNITHALIAGLVLLATLTLLMGQKSVIQTSAKTSAFTGVVMGIFGGLGSIGGLAGMVMLLSTTMDTTKARATMIVLLLLTSTYAAVFATYNGLLTIATIKQLLVLFIPTAAGCYVGHLSFLRYKRSFRTITLILLTLLSGIMLLQSLYQALG